MHTFNENNHTVIKLPRSGNSKAKNNNKKQFSIWKFSSTTNGMNALDNFYTDHPFVDYYKQPRTKDILSVFQKGSVFGLDDYQYLYLIRQPHLFRDLKSTFRTHAHSLRSPELEVITFLLYNVF